MLAECLMLRPRHFTHVYDGLLLVLGGGRSEAGGSPGRSSALGMAVAEPQASVRPRADEKADSSCRAPSRRQVNR